MTRRRPPQFTTELVDGEDATRVLTVSGQVLGTVRYMKVARGLSAGWAAEGYALPPLNARFESREDAIANLVEHRLDANGERKNPW